MRQLLRSISLIALISTVAQAQAILKVPRDYSSIQAAINASQNGDTIRVAPGTYIENINFLGKAVTVVSEAGHNVTTIDGNQANSVVQFISGEGSNSILEGFTIRNGDANVVPFGNDGGGIEIRQASPTIRGNRITNNRACNGAGVSIHDGSPLIQGNVISENTTSGCSGTSGGGIVLLFQSSPQILDNVITNNFATNGGGGIQISSQGMPTIRGNVISGNQASGGGGIDISSSLGSNAVILQNVIALNKANGRGGGIRWSVSTSASEHPYIASNTIVDNDANEGSAVYADGPQNFATLKDNLLIGKTGKPAIHCTNSNPTGNGLLTFTHNNVFSDQAAPYAGTCISATGTNSNISAAPSFVNRAAANFRLLSGSPGIDAGSNPALLHPLDFDRIPRILPVDGTVDMGAYEFAAPATATISPTDLVFTDQNFGTVSQPLDIVITNTGSTTLVVSGIVVTGEFSQTNTCQTAAGIPSGLSCTISVRFAPAAGGPRMGQLTISTNAGTESVTLAGNGIGPLMLSRADFNFGSVRVGMAPQETVTVSNTGANDVAISNIAITGVDFTTSNDCPSLLPADATCTITLQFAPTARATRYGAVTINDDASGSPHIVTFSGLGVAPTISFSPTSFGFAPMEIGSSATQNLTISNQGDMALTISSISLTGEFTSTHNCPASLGVNETCTVAVTFSPTTLGIKNGTITVTDDAIGSPHTVTISALVATLLTQTPSSLSFGNQAINVASSPRFVTLRNVGFSTLNTTITTSGEFSIIGSSCALLLLGQTCMVPVIFTPTSTGPKTGALTISHTSFGSPHVVPLSGSGIDVELSPSSLSFFNVQAGTAATLPVTFTNNSPNTVTITNIAITGSNSARFTQENTCGTNLAPGANCIISVTFAPVSGAVSVGTLTIADDALGNPHSILLSGIGVTGTVSLGQNLTFVPDVVGSSSPAQAVSLWNSGPGVLSLSSISTSGDFVQTNNCGATLAANATCAISVKFLPAEAGVRNGNVIVASDAPGSPHTVTLTGTGLASLPVPIITLLSNEIRAVGSPDLTLTVDGSGFSTMSVIRWDGVDRATTFVDPTRLTATIPAADFAHVRTAFLSVFNPAPGGGESTRIAFTVYREVTLTTNALVYDTIGARIYASVGATAPAFANTLTPIDPATGALGTSIAIGSDPSALAISRDSRHMYVALNAIGQVRHFDVGSQTAGTPFALGNDDFFGPHRAREIAIDPQNPATIAVSKVMGGFHAGVAIFDNGVARPVQTGSVSTSGNISEIVYGDEPSALYGYNGDTTEHGFRTMVVDTQGVVITNVTTGLIQAFADIRFESGRLYVSNGQVIDPVNRTEVGRFQLPVSGPPISVRNVVVDPSMARVFFLQPTTSFMRIVAFDLNTFALVGTMKVPASGGGSLIRWGEDGLAYRTFSQVYVVRIPASWRPASLTLAPSSGLQGQSHNVAVTGNSTGFVQGQTTANFGFGITVNSVTVVDSTHASVNITIASGAPAGPHTVTLTTGGQIVSSTFTVAGARGLLTSWGTNAGTPPLGLFRSIAAGAEHSLALGTDGTVLGWGSNVQGQIDAPAGTFTAVAAGASHSLAIRADGTLAGWGNNSAGQTSVPPGTFIAIAAGASHSLAIRTDGTLAGWGANNFGQIDVPAGTFIAIAAGTAHSLGIRSDGTLAGWGNNGHGQIDVPSGTFVAIAAGSLHSVGLRTDRTVVAWGNNDFGQTDVPSGTFTAIAVGEHSSLAIRTDGTLAGWGDNSLLGSVPSEGTYRAISAGRFHAVALKAISPARLDLNGDGRSDLLWRNANGLVAAWLMNGLGILQAGGFGTISNDWAVEGTGDLNGDGKSDIVWRHTDGTVAAWLMDGLVLAQGAAFGAIPGTWSIGGMGDLNGDGTSDIIWRHVDGTVGVWLMTGLTYQGVAFGTIPGTWSINGVGDLNGDGKSDIVWRNVDGTVGVWLMDGVTYQGAAFGTIAGTWSISGVGDLNGDGKSDIVWRNVDGTVAVWLMDGLVLAQGAALGTITFDWSLAGMGDLNGDGKSDIVWRHVDGTVAAWLMNGTSISQAGGFGTISADWTLQSSR